MPLNHLSCSTEIFFSDSQKSEESNRFDFNCLASVGFELQIFKVKKKIEHMKYMIWRRILFEPLEIPNNWLPKWNQWRRIDLRPKSQFDVRILIFFLISRIVKFWDFFQNAPIFLKFALLSNSNLLNKTQVSDLLSEATLIFCELTYANFKKNYIVW